ncbi:hypothetical protein [Persicobacter psychrovividus]|uniref:Lipoprotein n=1 Tax=Persicobacter psychrovividus TaxID=387638 RepID=A0ABM7VFW5_9BACT|nr:hypothetical protein PEPS_21260 [Persicobacter psychrovividus]
MKMISPFFRYALTATMLTCGLMACEDKKSQQATQETTPKPHTLLQLKHVADSNWQVMMTSDSQKFNYLHRLVQEVEYSDHQDAPTTKKLHQLISTLQHSRYDRNGIADTEKVIVYDSISQLTIHQVIDYCADLPIFSTQPTMKALVEGIQEEDARTLKLRINYDMSAFDFNESLEQNPEAKLQPMPTFIQE